LTGYDSSDDGAAGLKWTLDFPLPRREWPE